MLTNCFWRARLQNAFNLRSARGNYWSDYNGTDLCQGIYQNETGSDGIGDALYTMDANNTDNYPLMNPWSPPDIAVTNLTTAKTVIGQGYTCSVSLTFENLGNKIEAFNATVFANFGLSLPIPIHSEQMMLAMTNYTLTFKWNTTGFSIDNYILNAVVEPLQDETDTTNNNCTSGGMKLSIPGDINGDFKVTLVDLVLLANAYSSRPGDFKWNPNADINGNGVVDLADLVLLAIHYGQHNP